MSCPRRVPARLEAGLVSPVCELVCASRFLTGARWIRRDCTRLYANCSTFDPARRKRKGSEAAGENCPPSCARPGMSESRSSGPRPRHRRGTGYDAAGPAVAANAPWPPSLPRPGSYAACPAHPPRLRRALKLFELVPKLSIGCRSWVEGSAGHEQ